MTVMHAFVTGNKGEYAPSALMNGFGLGRIKTMSSAVMLPFAEHSQLPLMNAQKLPIVMPFPSRYVFKSESLPAV